MADKFIAIKRSGKGTLVMLNLRYIVSVVDGPTHTYINLSNEEQIECSDSMESLSKLIGIATHGR